MSNDLDNPRESYSQRVMVGAAFMVATRFSVRLLGLVSVTILARLLTPEDFGVFGTAALVLSFFVLLKEVGFGDAVVKTQDLTRADLDTLWTMRFILGLVTAIMLVVSTDFLAAFLKEPRIVDVLYAMAVIPVIDSFNSPASALLIKNFRYAHDFLLKSVDKLVRVVAVIILALTLKSYWALVYGALLSSVLGVIISQVAKSYVPHITLASRKKFFSFAFWTYWRGMTHFIAVSADEIVVRASVNSASFGIYRVARDVSRILVTETIAPIGEALLPALSKFANDPMRFSGAVYNVMGACLIAAVAISFGISLTSYEIVTILLGSQWEAAAPFLAVIAVGTACNALANVAQSIYIAKNVPKYGAMFWTIRAVSYSAACLISSLFWGTQGVVIAFSVASIVVIIAEFSFLFTKVVNVGTWPLLLVRPLAAGMIMILGVDLFVVDGGTVIWLQAILKISIGAFLYLAVILGLWMIMGRPRGPEWSIIERLPSKVKILLLPKVVKDGE